MKAWTETERVELAMNVALGTISHGTLRTVDLVEAFVDALSGIIEYGLGSDAPEDVRHVGYLHERLGDIERRVEASNDYATSEDSVYDLEWLMDTLQEFAPAGTYFGAHVGDGSDFGFWPDWDYIDTSGEVWKGEDRANAPGDYMEVCEVNERGNATFFLRYVDGRWREVWSVV